MTSPDRPGVDPPSPAPEAAAPPGRATRATDLPVLAAIAAGGALGTVTRHAVALAVDEPPGVFPWATFAVNATGSFALGLVLVVLMERFPPHRHLLPFLATGVLGAFTTYSTFAVEADLLVRDGRPAVALTYVVSTLATGLAAAWLGILAGRSTAGPRTRGHRGLGGTRTGPTDDAHHPDRGGKRRDT